jgi:hypothetical protein
MDEVDVHPGAAWPPPGNAVQARAAAPRKALCRAGDARPWLVLVTDPHREELNEPVMTHLLEFPTSRHPRVRPRRPVRALHHPGMRADARRR